MDGIITFRKGERPLSWEKKGQKKVSTVMGSVKN